MSDTAIDRSVWIRRVRNLSYFTIVYNVIEGIVSIYFGTNDESISLFGFGVDSFIEAASALVVLWRFSGSADLTLEKDQREISANRKIGFFFYALAAVTTGGALLQLARHAHPDTTLPGSIIAGISLSFMYALYYAKMRAGKALNSSVVLNDASCSLACIKLSFVLFAGSLIYYFFPSLWWTDSVAAIGISWFIFKEGREMMNPDECCGCD